MGKGYDRAAYLRAARTAKEREEKRKDGKKYLENFNPSPSETGMIRCPKCASTQISANKRGFSIGKALVFLPAGFVGMNKVVVTCLNCGHKWKPGKT